MLLPGTLLLIAVAPTWRGGATVPRAVPAPLAGLAPVLLRCPHCWQRLVCQRW